MDQEDTKDKITDVCSEQLFYKLDVPGIVPVATQPEPSSDIMPSCNRKVSSRTEDNNPIVMEDAISNGTCEVETVIALRCSGDREDIGDSDHLALSNDGMSEFSNGDLSLPEVCISTNSASFEEDMNYEIQQAYKIFSGFLLDKHKGMTSSFRHPIGHQKVLGGIGRICSQGQTQLKPSMCLQRMEEKFVSQEYGSITEFVADFRLMLENCYRYHGVDHWISKQAQKLEVMLEQKLTLLSRTLREKTALAVTSQGRFGAEEERSSLGTTTRRRLAPRSLGTITIGGHESVMVQTLRLEEQQRAKEEKRLRELEKKEAEEMSAKEVDDWEQSLLSEASPHTIDTLWELPAIGHFLCLAQTALNLPEIVFFELERCLLMPRCSLLLAKVMSSLLSPPQRRAMLHRWPAVPYRRWESELRQRVTGWYRAVGASRNQPVRAEKLGLCHQFFRVLGEVSPLEEKPFHLLPFYQRIWLLKGLCDHVYETQKDVQDAVLAQPIHECRESILGYDNEDNAYIHFPHFCGADLRIYCQSPSTPPAFPFPSIWVKKIDTEPCREANRSGVLRDRVAKTIQDSYRDFMDTGKSNDRGTAREDTPEGDEVRLKSWSVRKEDDRNESGSSEGDSLEDCKLSFHIHSNSLSLSCLKSPPEADAGKLNKREDLAELEHQTKNFTIIQEPDFSPGTLRTVKAETHEPCLSVGEHCYTGRSPARSVNFVSHIGSGGTKMEEGCPGQRHQGSFSLESSRSKTTHLKSEQHQCCHDTSRPGTLLSSESAPILNEELVKDRVWTKRKRRKKKRRREQLLGVKGEQLQCTDRMRLCPAEAAESAFWSKATAAKRKDKKKQKTGKKLESSTIMSEECSVEPSFKLICTSLEQLRQLIGKTEDELDDLESTKNKLGRWYYRRQAVKELHSTLIRLLNELTPWEPKLIKAYQRNRLRLKKEFDEFKEYPDYSNFVREECVSSSSWSSSSEEEDSSLGKEAYSFPDHDGRLEEDDIEHVVPRCIWTGVSTTQFMTESVGEKVGSYGTFNHLKNPLASTDDSRLQAGSSNITSTPESALESRADQVQSNHSSNSHSTSATRIPASTLLSSKQTIFHPTTGLPKGYTPIPTLFAKSVGNKVTLMKWPIDCLEVNSIDRQSKGCLVSQPSSAVATTKPLQHSPSNSQNSLQNTQALIQPLIATMSAAVPESPQMVSTVPVSPVQVVYKVSEGLGHLVRAESSSSIKSSLKPVVDQTTDEKITQQVVFLPSKSLLHINEENGSLHHSQSKSIQVPIPKVSSPKCTSSSIPGFKLPESTVPVQEGTTVTDTRSVRTPSVFVSPCVEQGPLNTAGCRGPQICNVRSSTHQGVIPNPLPIASPTRPVSTESESTDSKQELKTVCIRDSQSILVTTRGGNTGIVKVQTSSEQNALGSLSTSPVITISPQLKAFLISKMSQSVSVCTPSQTSSCSVPEVTSISVAQPQKQDSSVLKSFSTITTPILTTVSESISVEGLGTQSVGTTATLSQSCSMTVGPTVVTRTGQVPQTAVCGSYLQSSLVKETAVVPSLSRCSIPHGPSQVQEMINQAGVKRASTDKGSQFTKFILLTPPSSSNAAVLTVTSSTNSLPTSRVIFISKPTAASSSTYVGTNPKQVLSADTSQQLLARALSTQTSKIGLSPGRLCGGVTSDVLSEAKNISLPSGVPIRLPGQTTTIGQTVGAPSYSHTGPLMASTTGQILATSSNTVTSSPAKFASQASLTPQYQLKGISSVNKTSQQGSTLSTSTHTTLPPEDRTKNNIGLTTDILSRKSPASGTATLQSFPVHSATPTLLHQFPKSGCGMGAETTSVISSSHQVLSKTQISVSSINTTPASLFGKGNQATTKTTHVPTTCPTSRVQRRIVINTSAPLAAGTHILFNNARFVIPPHGLGPGNHILIISSPEPQQVPISSATTMGEAAPPQEVTHTTVAPQPPILPQTSATMPGVLNPSSCVASSAIGSSPPNVSPVRLTASHGLCLPLLPSTADEVSCALPRFQASQTGNLASTVTGIPVRHMPMVSTSGVVSPCITSTPAVSSILVTVGLTGDSPMQAKFSQSASNVAPAQTLTMPRFLVSSSLSSVLANDVLPAAANLPLTVAPSSTVIGGTPCLHSPLTAQEGVSVSLTGPDLQLQQGAVQFAGPSSTPSQALSNTRLCNMSFKQQGPPAIQPVLADIQTQASATVAVSPVASSAYRMQTQPVATVSPFGRTVKSSEAPSVIVKLPTTSTAIGTALQPVGAQKASDAIHPPVLQTSQALEKSSLQMSAIGMPNKLPSKLLISPDGAVLTTVQCLRNPAEQTNCPEPQAALMVCPSSFSGASHISHKHDCSSQPSQADTE
ncbi:uncharacterized protein KIAA2026-like [Thalassophryne amazonica]|uniref:uncharacterized protein KIAA2026-like n=1 Tax=Thalassophryne amazonica TaxID=390379 RepID=UPI0014719ECF|nr:uncharacterized protein KIAA2026-like [Thalassophryne amazonica]XP_034047618.1 uncharacterized protein KIAA2026-like [Thalassophryne amazonica]